MEGRKRGRPKKEGGFNEQITFRSNKNQQDMLNKIAKKCGCSVSDVMRDALEKYYYLKSMGESTYNK